MSTTEPLSEPQRRPASDDTGQGVMMPHVSAQERTGPDLREPLGRLVHDTRLACEADRAAAEGRQKFHLAEWEDRSEHQRELDMRIGEAVRDRVLNAGPAGGELVRETWVYWALEQPDVAEHPNWLKSWAELDERDREVDDRIYSAAAAKAVYDAGLEAAAMRKQLLALSVQFPAIRRALVIAISGAEYEAEAKDYRAALRVLGGETQERSDGKEGDRG